MHINIYIYTHVLTEAVSPPATVFPSATLRNRWNELMPSCCTISYSCWPVHSCQQCNDACSHVIRGQWPSLQQLVTVDRPPAAGVIVNVGGLGHDDAPEQALGTASLPWYDMYIKIYKYMNMYICTCTDRKI